MMYDYLANQLTPSQPWAPDRIRRQKGTQLALLPDRIWRQNT